MANLDPQDAVITTTALGRLTKLSKDKHIVAFGPNGRQFFATLNGYFASQLPMKILAYISSGAIRQIIHASYGSHLGSWFFAYRLANGSSFFSVGPAIPAALKQYIEKIRAIPHLRSALRVQLGDEGSFVAWTHTSWACRGVPSALEAELCQMSCTHVRSTTVTGGSFKSELKLVTWHGDGSYYVESQEQRDWNFESTTTRQAWKELWYKIPTRSELDELVLVALNPHASFGESFAFIKRQHDAEEPPFAIHFSGEPVFKTTDTNPALPVPDMRLLYLQEAGRTSDVPRYFQWAVSKRDGRPHRGESRELELQKGQRVKVWEDRGRDWFIVEGRGGVKGWVHGTWLEFCGGKLHKDPKSTYMQFQEDMQKLLVPGQLQVFPALSEYTSACSKAACQPLRSSSTLGICAHDLQMLLEGSGNYSYQWLKEERNVWHPDKFARYCQAACKQRLRGLAQEVFVLYGVLMDSCRENEG